MTCRPPLPFLAVRLDSAGRRWRLPRTAEQHMSLLNLPVSGRYGEPGLPFSFVAMPGRYLAEMFLYGRQAAGSRPLAILNPAYDLPPDALSAIAAELNDAGPGAPGTRVLVDTEGRIIAFVFHDAHAVSRSMCFELRFLSCFDAQLDASLLSAAGLPARLSRVRMPMGFTAAQSMPHLRGIEAMAWYVADRRRVMLSEGSSRLLAVITHHAGDVFLAMRVLAACDSGATGVVVHERYADIVREVCPALDRITVRGPLPSRGAAVSMAHPLNDELLYFEEYVLPLLPGDASILWMRVVRDYVSADTTVAAQLAFAAGDAADAARFPQGQTLMLNPETLGAGAPGGESADASGGESGGTSGRESARASAGDAAGASAAVAATAGIDAGLLRIPGRRVLLHFDGGWPLKVYPPRLQRELVDRLLAHGYQVSVLDSDIGPDVPSHRFSGLAGLNALLNEHDVLVGMDSFPCHYASQQRGVPVLCLFASTRITNLAHGAPGYLAVSEGLACSPCGSRSACPRFGGTECRNFIAPAAVVALLDAGLVDS